MSKYPKYISKYERLELVAAREVALRIKAEKKCKELELQLLTNDLALSENQYEDLFNKLADKYGLKEGDQVDLEGNILRKVPLVEEPESVDVNEPDSTTKHD
jgi:hypothetical protein